MNKNAYGREIPTVQGMAISFELPTLNVLENAIKYVIGNPVSWGCLYLFTIGKTDPDNIQIV